MFECRLLRTVVCEQTMNKNNGTKEVVPQVCVGIHVRRTDIISREIYSIGIHPVNYYQRAMDHFRIKYNSDTHIIVKFIIASNDIACCARQPMFIQHSNTIVLISDTYDPVTEMSVLSHCHHVSLSIGTFGWWAAYLAGGKHFFVGTTCLIW
jgi:galactoside 2-L-fucosyltransferase 1/2